MRAIVPALAALALFATACGGSVDGGPSGDTDGGGGGSAGSGGGGTGGGGAGGGGVGGGGIGGGGVGGGPIDAGPPCVTSAECGRGVDPPCTPCADGTIECATFECLNGACVEIFPPCLPPYDGGGGSGGGPQCSSSVQCSVPSVCQICPDGVSYTCANAECINGYCETYFPPCPMQDAGPYCKSDAECAVPPYCQVCPDGVNYSCSTSSCVNGMCEVGMKPCPAYDGGTGTVVCGGFAGYVCPGYGACVDYPYDGCDPAKGGADCPGECLCNVATPCPSGSYFDSSPQICACSPYTYDGGTGQTCQADAECPQLGIPCQLCADGYNANCPQSLCLNGTCAVHWSGCPATSTTCAPQDARGVGACAMFLGFVWDGKQCVGIGGCSCSGADCKAVYQDPSLCKIDHARCP